MSFRQDVNDGVRVTTWTILGGFLVLMIILAGVLTWAKVAPWTTDVQREINQNSQQFQDAQTREARVLLEGIAVSQDEGQKQILISRFCSNLENIEDLPSLPFYEWSQYRETLLSITDAQAKGTATTSFFFNQGVNKPIKICSSIGYPVATTTQISSPDQHEGSSGAVVAQMEPTGVYTGDSSGTYVVCVDNGVAVPTYWEGFVHTEGGPAKWDNDQQMIVNSGPPSVKVSTE